MIPHVSDRYGFDWIKYIIQDKTGKEVKKDKKFRVYKVGAGRDPALFSSENYAKTIKFLNEYSFSRWCSLIIFQLFFNFSSKSSSFSPFNGGTPPLQGIQVFFAKSLIIKPLF